MEIDGILVWGGEFNMVLKTKLDTTNTKKHQNSITKYLNWLLNNLVRLMSGGNYIPMKRIIPITQCLIEDILELTTLS